MAGAKQIECDTHGVPYIDKTANACDWPPTITRVRCLYGTRLAWKRLFTISSTCIIPTGAGWAITKLGLQFLGWDGGGNIQRISSRFSIAGWCTSSFWISSVSTKSVVKHSNICKTDAHTVTANKGRYDMLPTRVLGKTYGSRMMGFHHNTNTIPMCCISCWQDRQTPYWCSRHSA